MKTNQWQTMDGLMEIGVEHWREYLPKMTLRLLKAGTLLEKVFEAANATYQSMESLKGKTLDLQQAWEMTREEFLLLHAESGWDNENNASEKALQKMTLPGAPQILAFLKTSPQAKAAGWTVEA